MNIKQQNTESKLIFLNLKQNRNSNRYFINTIYKIYYLLNYKYYLPQFQSNLTNQIKITTLI
jgi:hypothetical protein